MTSAPARRERLTPRVLSTADERREDVLRAAMEVVGARGLYGTPTLDIARAAGISQAYLFRLFPTKTELFVAVLERSFQRIHDTLDEAAREAQSASGRPHGHGRGLHALLEDPESCSSSCRARRRRASPTVRDALRRGFAGLLDMVERESGASPQEIQLFFAHGMLCNVIAAMQIDELGEHWAEVLAHAARTSTDKCGSVSFF